MKKLLVATENKGKLIEIREILGDEYEVLSLADSGITLCDVVEDGETFEQNAYIKAKSAYDKSGLDTLADDSGLCVDALDGAPGIYSARYSGKGDKANNELLIKNLSGETNRNARFVCAICLIRNGKPIFARGEVLGTILHSPQGNGGFGYDPLFFCNEINKSFASASQQEKNAVSHRKKALENLKAKLNETL